MNTGELWVILLEKGGTRTHTYPPPPSYNHHQRVPSCSSQPSSVTRVKKAWPTCIKATPCHCVPHVFFKLIPRIPRLIIEFPAPPGPRTRRPSTAHVGISAWQWSVYMKIQLWTTLLIMPTNTSAIICHVSVNMYVWPTTLFPSDMVLKSDYTHCSWRYRYRRREK
jgi:hypothetical protein